MGEDLSAANAAFEAFKAEFPEVGNYFCFLAGWVACQKYEDGDTE